MKKILFIQSEFDFNQFFDEKIFPNRDDIEFEGIKYLNETAEYFSKYTKVYSCDYFDEYAYSIIKKAKSTGVDTFLLMDGIYDWANLYVNPKWEEKKNFFDVSFYKLIYCVDSHSASYLSSTGASTDVYAPSRIFNITTKDKTKKNKIINTSKKKILITSSNTPYFDKTEFIRIINIFKSVIEWGKLNSVDIYYRIYNEKILKELDINQEVNLTEGSIDTYLKEIDVLITTPSSISITAAALDKPFIHIIYRDTPIAVQAAWQIFNPEMSSEVLKSALIREENRMMHQRTIIPKMRINLETKKINKKNEDVNVVKYSSLKLFLVILKSKLKGLYYKLFKY